MRRALGALLATVSSFGLVCGALAADLPVKAPPIAVVSSWTGFYFGANGGYGWGSNRVNYTANDIAAQFGFDLLDPDGLAAQDNRFATSGWVAGLQAGYNRQVAARWVVGVEADFSGANIRGSERRNGEIPPLLGSPNPFAFTGEEKVRAFGTIRGRLGTLPTENLLVFVTGGFAYANVQHRAVLTSLSPGSVSFSNGAFSASCAPAADCFVGSTSRWLAGWAAGGGIEHKWRRDVSIKAEFLHVHLGRQSVTSTASADPLAPGTGPASFNANFGRTHFNVVRAGVNWHFPPN